MSLIRGDALTIPLADDSVDLIVTSPPYFALRSYTDDGEHYNGQLGSEATPAAFIDALIGVTRECVRVLKPSGSCFVNLGDKYAEKGLMGLPWRYALRCIDDLGLILRAEIIWSKPNGLPESVQDRVRRSHEQWFHFTLEPRYFSAVDEIREEHAEATLGRNKYARGRSQNGGGSAESLAGFDYSRRDDLGDMTTNVLGKLPGSVWTIPTEPLQVPDDLPQHFAAFPSEWPRRIVLGWSPSGICCECGQGRRPVVESERVGVTQRRDATTQIRGGGNGGGYSLPGADTWQRTDATITGESCACPTPDAPTRKAVILDPFAGTGTTVAVANTLGRFGVGVDLSADYLKLARWRCQDPGLRAKVLRVDKPAPEVPGQMALL